MNRRCLSITCLLLACIVGAFALCAASVAEDWPIYRGPTYNGISAETGWFKAGAKPKVLWTMDIGRGCSAITVIGDIAFTMGNKGDKDYVYCVNAASGKEVWSFDYPEKLAPKLYEGGPNATPTVHDGKVYTISKSGKVFCLDAASGDKIWGIQLEAKAPKWGFSGSILPLGDKLIINAGGHGVALNKADGKVVWESGKGPGGYSTPVPVERGGKTVVLLFCAKEAVAVEVDSGKVVWRHPWVTSYDVNAADPVVVEPGKKVFISSGYKHGCALLDVSGDKPVERWSNKDMRNKHTNTVLWKGAFYGFDEKTLTCMDLADGKVIWTQSGMGMGALMLADGKLIILSDKGELVIAEASRKGYTELARAQVVRGPCWTMPVLANGRIFARSRTGMLSCSSFVE